MGCTIFLSCSIDCTSQTKCSRYLTINEQGVFYKWDSWSALNYWLATFPSLVVQVVSKFFLFNFRIVRKLILDRYLKEELVIEFTIFWWSLLGSVMPDTILIKNPLSPQLGGSLFFYPSALTSHYFRSATSQFSPHRWFQRREKLLQRAWVDLVS